ncbi:hypothetical protein DFH11DRAFT_463871 [Phellopilus nigrolimitatus]|nr:hypothetical protein DFH11DRAFT_463871 [Phellopilus nigrolimitatus]
MISSDHVRIALSIAHALQFQVELDAIEDGGMPHVAESAWYMTVLYTLSLLFVETPLVTINPQRPIRRIVHSNRRDKKVSKKLVPDFVAYLSQYRVREGPGLTLPLITRTAIILVVENKPVIKERENPEKVKFQAWDQALMQAAYALDKQENMHAKGHVGLQGSPEQIGVMVTIGTEWAFNLITKAQIPALPTTTETDIEYIEHDGLDISQSSEDSDRQATVKLTELSGIIDSRFPTRTYNVGGHKLRALPREETANPKAKTKTKAVPRTKAPAKKTIRGKVSKVSTGSNRNRDTQARRPGMVAAAAENTGEFFDSSTVCYFTFGTPESAQALKDMREKLKGMSGYQSEDWQRCWDVKRRYVRSSNLNHSSVMTFPLL